MSKWKEFDRASCAAPAGGWKNSDLEMLKKQRGVLWDIVQQMGRNLMNGTDIMRTAFPVYINDPRSYLDVIADGWCYAPVFLTRAAALSDPVERLKLVVCFVMSGLLNTCSAAKPFNPVLGETFQGEFADGTQIFTEQSCHHPPVTSWQVFGPANSYRMYGYGEWTASFHGNSVTGHQRGRHVVEFPSDGQQIVYTLAKAQVHGVMWGDRIIEYDGDLSFDDAANGLSCKIQLPVPGTQGGWFSSRKLPTDHFAGEVIQTKDGKSTTLSQCMGSWLGAIEWDGKQYWHHSEPKHRHRSQPKERLLASDCSFRPDICLLRDGDATKAAEKKTELEERQRADRRLREVRTAAREGNGASVSSAVDAADSGDGLSMSKGKKSHKSSHSISVAAAAAASDSPAAESAADTPTKGKKGHKSSNSISGSTDGASADSRKGKK